MRVIVSARAAAEARAGAIWYREHAPQTVEGFRVRFRGARTMLADFPEAGPPLGNTRFRRLSLEPYPFVVLYEIEPDRVTIVGVLQARQSIDEWLRRSTD